MTTTVSRPEAAEPSAAAPNPRRWLALTIIAIAQLMVVLDATIVNIALPAMQGDLGITDAERQWVLTAYTLTFGGLLLLGGRIADYWGRKRTFIAGAIGFAAASALGGLAWDGLSLFAARGLQGAFGALLAPAGLALLTVLFTDAKERAKAFAVYGAIAGGGAAVGLLLGGVLTEYADWRWCLLVNIPIAVIAIAAAIPFVPESKATGNTRYDIPGAIVVTLGLISLVYGLTKAAEPEHGWDSPEALAYMIGGALLLVVFVIIQKFSKNPLLPLRILLDRNRGGAYLSSTLTGAGLMGAFFFLTFYFQGVLGYTPIEAGLASLPISAGVFISAGVASQLLPKLGAKPLMIAGAVLAAGSMLFLTQIGVTTSYTTHVLPGAIVLGLGLGFTFVPLSSLALVGVPQHDAGAASATLNATQQVGGSLGAALLSTFALNATTDYAAEHLKPGMDPQTAGFVQAEAAVHGFATAFAWGGGLLVVSAIVITVLIKVRKSDLPTEGAVHVG
ncbi:MFS transporter [Catellatospora sp. NPDC049133]|jgi:EmrB/QacA subfamily drug resistance transporter|uniref:MFS transporter n=1 Tax=Catellatospora sp. NPDC049133 TaxID=3155499 RepID=UPI0033FDC465